MVWGGRWEGGSGWATRVHPWWMHVDVWQNQYNIVTEARRGSQGASRAAPGKSGMHACGEGERVVALESREGTRASRRVEEGLSRSFSGGGGKPSFPSPSAGDLRELPKVPLRGEGSCGGGGAPRDSAGSGAMEEGLPTAKIDTEHLGGGPEVGPSTFSVAQPN